MAAGFVTFVRFVDFATYNRMVPASTSSAK
jgi:hypothetical protein